MILSDIIVLVNKRYIKNGRWCMCMKEYIANLEKELTLIENGFKEQEKEHLLTINRKVWTISRSWRFLHTHLMSTK